MMNVSTRSRLLRQQGLYLSVPAVMVCVSWAIGQRINPASVVLYMLVLGNLATLPMSRVRRMASKRPAPYNWLIFLTALLVITPIIYLIASVVVAWIAPPSAETVGQLIRNNWKLPCLAIVVYGTLRFIYLESRGRLERRNAELQQSLEVSAAELEKQEEDLQRAREIQQSLLPKDIPQVAGFEVAAEWKPARLVGGDYFDVLKLGENRLGICIADVSGKGVAAALLMASVQAMVRAFAGDSESPAKLCTRVNSVLCGNIAIGKFVTFFYGVLDGEKRTLQYCNAGHPRPILLCKDSSRQLAEGGAVLGVFPEWKYEDAPIGIGAKDRLILCTDGITEAAGADGEEFGEARLSRLAEEHRGQSATEMSSKVLAGVNEFCAGQFQDDATLLVIASE